MEHESVTRRSRLAPELSRIQKLNRGASTVIAAGFGPGQAVIRQGRVTCLALNHERVGSQMPSETVGDGTGHSCCPIVV